MLSAKGKAVVVRGLMQYALGTVPVGGLRPVNKWSLTRA